MLPEEVDAKQIVAGLAAVRGQIATSAAEVGRSPDEVTLVAVSKSQPVERITAAIAEGQTAFGENRIPEAEEKWPEIRAAFPDVRLHLIGPLQRNKVRRAVELFDVIETVDRPKLARHLAEVMAEMGHRPEVLIQVNTGEEPQKNGVLPEETDALVRLCRDEFGLPVTGLMCIPPQDEEPALHFALLREIARRNGLTKLSMGMTADYPTAVRFGATSVRVGTAIFGPRLVL
ncbi:MAG: YggS family pyridoxal phosphate-dependent enzyme [Rhodospirillales bacterium]|nr:YggS family pyridoxal phosphate-dependent enzyme [Rhodospirillales bacterium]